MRLIQIDDYKQESMELGKPIYDVKGRVLLGAGHRIHPKYLEKLKSLDIRYLIVEDAVSKGITLDEIIDMPTWIDAIRSVYSAYKTIKDQHMLPFRELQSTVKKLITEVRRRRVIMLAPSTYAADEVQEQAHCVNVTLIALQLGKFLKYNELQLNNLAFGCLVHDIGKAVSDRYEDHPVKGFNLIRNVREVHLACAHIAYQHHECMDGQGFPRKIAGNEILEFAQICAIANEYEHLISHERISPYTAIEMLMTKSDQVYSHKIVDALFKSIPSYLPGMRVELNTGEEAIVTKIENHLHRPFIRLLESGEEYSLEDNPTVIIKGELSSF
ncbi:HD-GYP domain-containing protein [Alkalihalobacterium elongatum]|uniref:HD-GYP domain-containing protein n=1 Tax=Alkalihalobacterium elongatum TaxID=2675466 RepID=UPI001C201288|nr:HD domain-containing phosphohydrolase [Alkalihalobacterium elongatum]